MTCSTTPAPTTTTTNSPPAEFNFPNPPPSPPSQINFPIAFNIVTEISLTKKNQQMSTWVECFDISNRIISEVNKIWLPAEIVFSISRCKAIPALTPSNIEAFKIDIVTYSRKDLTSSRKSSIEAFLPPPQPNALNLYLFPYVGDTSQGYANRGGKGIVLGVWTDKPSRGLEPPKKTKIVEPLPMEEGSLSRTVAHEIGHVLGLRHPEDSPTSLMGRDGYTLTTNEINKAREKAATMINENNFNYI